MTEKYALFSGCIVPARLPWIEYAARAVLKKIGIRAENLGFLCCPDPVSVRGANRKLWLVLAAWNLALAQERGLDIVTVCNGCFETLRTAKLLLADAGTREQVNDTLAELGKSYSADGIEVLHVVHLLYKNIERLEEAYARRATESVRVAPHAGCHLLRPRDVASIDDVPADFFEQLLYAANVEVLDYETKDLCCGINIAGAARELAAQFAARKITELLARKADCLVLCCPACFLQYDSNRKLPVLHCVELLALVLGAVAPEKCTAYHITNCDALLAKMGLK
jgi:heterodisulfide reductase subunit B